MAERPHKNSTADPANWPALHPELVQTDSLRPDPDNPRKHPDKQIAALGESLNEWGQTLPILATDDGVIVKGEAVWLAAKRRGLEKITIARCVGWTPEQIAAYRVADNRLAEDSTWDQKLLRFTVQGLGVKGFHLPLLGFTDVEIRALLGDGNAGAGSLRDRFLAVPFTVLNAREGWWQARKRAWISLGIESEVGRGKVLPGFATARHVQGKDPETWVERSIFDPVVCELAYRWFSPPEARVLDPFAGGSVRGVVASRLGRRYLGLDLSATQVAANVAQAELICAEDPSPPVWWTGDSRQVLAPDAGTADLGEFDFLFSCPPYGDLEQYSEDPHDLSNMAHREFITAYRAIIAQACAVLRRDRFACFVVGDFRDSRGSYRNFVSDTIAAFLDAGLALYNEAILVTQVGSLPVRVGRAFESTRKLGKTHQQVLVFVKGDPRAATKACGQVEMGDIEPDDGAEQGDENGG